LTMATVHFEGQIALQSQPTVTTGSGNAQFAP
jgi:hypothetical protein